MKNNVYFQSINTKNRLFKNEKNLLLRRFNVVNAKTGKMISGRISANADILGTESTAYNLSYYQKLNKKIQKG